MAELAVGQQYQRWTIVQLVPAEYPRFVALRCECGRPGFMRTHFLARSKQCSACSQAAMRKRAKERMQRAPEAAE